MKLTDRQRKQIIAEYVAGDGKVSQRELAEKYGVSRQAISKILKDKESCEKLRNKKKENELAMLAFLQERCKKAQKLIDKILDTLPNDFENASMRDKAGLLKILADVFGGIENKDKEDEGLKVIVEHRIGDLSEGAE